MSGTHPGLVPDYRTGLRTGRRLPDWLRTGSAQNSAELFFSEIPHVSGLGFRTGYCLEKTPVWKQAFRTNGLVDGRV